MKLTDKKLINGLTWLCSFAYFISYISRINLSAVMVEVVKSGFSPQATVAMAITLCSVTYGAGQIISGFLGDKYKPQNIIFCGFIITAAVNLSVAFLRDSVWLTVLWSINGFAQAFMWPPMVKILSHLLTEDDYSSACVKVSWGSSFGTIAVYLIAPVLISVLNFRYMFIVSGVLALMMCVFWKIQFNRRFSIDTAIRAEKKNSGAEQTYSFAVPVIMMMAVIMLGIILQGVLRDGIANWMPTYMSETFKLSSSVSILTGIVLPIFSILCFHLTHVINRTKVRNELLCAAIFFGGCFVSSFLLVVTGGKNAALATLLLALSNGCMHGVNLCLICFVPPYFAKYGHVSLVSGILNSCTYVGSAVSTYGISLFSEAYGWSSTVILWTAIALAGTALCVVFARKWTVFKNR